MVQGTISSNFALIFIYYIFYGEKFVMKREFIKVVVNLFMPVNMRCWLTESIYMYIHVYTCTCTCIPIYDCTLNSITYIIYTCTCTCSVIVWTFICTAVVKACKFINVSYNDKTVNKTSNQIRTLYHKRQTNVQCVYIQCIGNYMFIIIMYNVSSYIVHVCSHVHFLPRQ